MVPCKRIFPTLGIRQSPNSKRGLNYGKETVERAKVLRIGIPKINRILNLPTQTNSSIDEFQSMESLSEGLQVLKRKVWLLPSAPKEKPIPLDPP